MSSDNMANVMHPDYILYSMNVVFFNGHVRPTHRLTCPVRFCLSCRCGVKERVLVRRVSEHKTH